MALSRRQMLAGLACLPLPGCATTTPVPGVALMTAPPLLVRSPAPWKRHLGALDDVAPELQVAFADARGFMPLPPPSRQGWRTLRPEPPQTVAEFRDSAPNTRTAPRDRIALLPLGEFPFEVVVDGKFVDLVRTPDLPAIAAVLEAFFATPVDILPCEPLPASLLPRRVVAGRSQYDARALLDLVSRRLPANAHSMLTLVNVDMFVMSEQEYAFGWSTLRDRLGVVGFSRLGPSHDGGSGGDGSDTLLRRGLALAIHEVGHMFGLGHCQVFRCVMNGMSDLPELDATPPRLCPLCLRKLHIVTGLDPRTRDSELLRAHESVGLVDEARWLDQRARLLWRTQSLHAAGPRH